MSGCGPPIPYIGMWGQSDPPRRHASIWRVGPRTFIRFAHQHDVTAMALTRRHSGHDYGVKPEHLHDIVSDRTSFFGG